MTSEATALKFSAWMNVFMAALGIFFAIWSESQAILLDGIFSLVNLVGAVLTIKVSRMVLLAPDDRMHFGYAQFEPFLNTAKGLMVLGVAAFAGVAAVTSRRASSGTTLTGADAIQTDQPWDASP